MRGLLFCLDHVFFCCGVVGLWRFGVVKVGGCGYDLLERWEELVECQDY